MSSQLLGHRSIKTTLRYIQLANIPQEERFISKFAMNVKEATKLIELGFEYVTGEYNDGGKIFRNVRFHIYGRGLFLGGRGLAWMVTPMVITIQTNSNSPTNPLFS